MSSLFTELQRRNVPRAAVFYAGAAWLLVQIATQVFPFFHIAESVVRWIVIAVIVGFPFAMLFSWVYEWTPQGIKLESEIERSESVKRQTGRAMDRWIIAVMATAIVLLLTNTFVLHNDAGKDTPAVAAGPVTPDKSIAVLPFTDLSAAHDQEYFSDGMAEELLNALAKVKDLKVAGRTSSFSFKGRNEDLRAIGQALSVANILEGSVRKQGNKVRITSQLIQVKDGYHLWSETYDGELTDIFDLQEKIARAITQQLQIVLQGEQQARLVPVATNNPEAYALYLQATTIFNRRDGAHFTDAIEALQQAIRLDPRFARAHARLAALYSIAPAWTTMTLDEARAATQQEAQIAIGLDATLAEPHAALGEIYQALRQPLAARNELATAVALDAGDANANVWLGEVLYIAGYRKEAAAYYDKALAIDPLLPFAQLHRGTAYLFAGDLARARPLLQQALDEGLVIAERNLAFLAHEQGRDTDAIAQMAHGEKPFLSGFPEGAGQALAEGVFGNGAARAKAVSMVEAQFARHSGRISGTVPWALLALGEPERSLEVAGIGPTSNDNPYFFLLGSPYGAAARKLSQFQEFARNTGWIDVWDQYGAPDSCRRITLGQYVCQ